MDLGLKNKIALISGGSRGIGKGIAAALLQEGCRVIICARNKEQLQNTARELKQITTVAGAAGILPVQADITRSGDVEKIVKTAIDEFGRIDILINNAGGNRRKLFEQTTDTDWQEILDLNLNAHIHLSRRVIPYMKKQQQGVIVFISSIFGRESGGTTLSIYNTTKSALISLAKIMAVELAPCGIRVNSIAPGSIRFAGGSWDERAKKDPEGITEFIKREMPLGRFGTVEEVANVVTFLVSEKASLVTGACINIDGGQSRSLI
jgi:3-oxoacyl-[acyl-carrier protein] reductase